MLTHFLATMTPKRESTGEIAFTPRQVLGWFTLIAMIGGAFMYIATQAAAIELNEYRILKLESAIEEQQNVYYTRAEAVLQFAQIENSLKSIDSKLDGVHTSLELRNSG